MIPVLQKGAEWDGLIDLGSRLELVRGLRQRLIEKEQPRADGVLGHAELGIEPCRVGIDVEMRHARQHARLVPAAETMTGRDEGELAAEIAFGRFRQTLDAGLPVVPFEPLGQDQEVL